MGSNAPNDGYTQFLDRFVEAVNAHDLDRIMPMLAPECEWERAVGTEAHGKRHVGHDEIREGIKYYFKLFPDCNWSDTTVYIDDNRDAATIEWLFSYTTFDGNTDAVRGVDVITFKDGLVGTKHTYHKNRSVE